MELMFLKENGYFRLLVEEISHESKMVILNRASNNRRMLLYQRISYRDLSVVKLCFHGDFGSYGD